ncbi:RAC-gamma serine/threonine-protein kinase [Clarias magur]|uniref:RAC-gamma serine/threonine-protein kinase n=1 Tax=Clarias magur TaxID=1594786 RepID=A0A8J4TDH3_CLAMG|nr:RAC-gamma serine/threonine-protein kinase [Clarias magur]
MSDVTIVKEGWVQKRGISQVVTVELSAGSHMVAMLSPAGLGTLCTERRMQ